LQIDGPGTGAWSVSGPLAVTNDDTVWLKSSDGWHAVARSGVALRGSTSDGTPPAPEARLAGDTLLVGSGTAARRLALPGSALPPATPTPLPDAVVITWSARSADSGVVWAVIADRSRRTAAHLTLMEVTAAGDVRSIELPPPPDDAPAPYALTSTGVAALNGNDPQITLYSAG
jgi:hypothetical protein